MFLFIPLICGAQNFDSNYDSNPAHQGLYCPKCHNFSVAPIKRKEFFTFWYIPIIPLYWGKQLRCNICNWRQDFKNEEELNRVVNEQKNFHNGNNNTSINADSYYQK
ncbi:uncharacterized protein KNAG_0H00940 [Huiozyma naganishii CBS 8797]|uniref:Zinc-ribbon 15 domain-containing protein n=1 Tax=Huiozyma naganishii (strain ATCC MYA-139 / BCRC 22969 / CBS 8797 / KCTC 17520 / NBRC 10181 / NCYC 3082 / Yp74L-3) TaxID=1071383 RepID=J7S8F9_HUIN7|nr:hypothetical protein KNAG_0H00940 [Kazachstania naganishii CBS 8797]CCK71509.1 hypothetical protein KNAG_0H00940 [Kazachstania naganishii CBS 8797]